MWKYNNVPDNDTLVHWGVKGMRWGYTHGRPNGGETAEDPGAGPAGGGGEDEEDEEVRVNGGYSDSLFTTTSTRSSNLSGGKKTTVVKTGKIDRLTNKAKAAVDKALKSAFGTKDKVHVIKTSSGKTITRKTSGQEGAISKAVNKALSKLKR